ncbi:KpsF/GutQ family sugar-phosphate isomerase [Parachitinimonas caeni]|uniref:KpsF/GutQ family sugar-phosphate isomerase n=1 Tax=Parachitinimonas caeni TaxID=3031301 RepID=A0ABT7DT10_9NEIS|nr:KpsF/GutQ family sugar-phosphate isomerase [Parachitinimonas caeni]MDK2123176.1 KpsF/GutQ family sugar-phosphate isomerase [Parachitinimonas caeni]
MTEPQISSAEPDIQTVLASARNVLKIEADAILNVAMRLDPLFVRAHTMILSCKGRVVVSGMGKSGHIARKIAATLASTGTPAFFVHPAEAAHGDLGMITADDIWLALSNSGEVEELTSLLPAIKRKGIAIIAMTGNASSTLAKAATVHLDAKVDQEACPLNLAPTASTTAALALGDALAVTLLESRGFGREDFALSHPGGSLGRKLLVHVRDIMHSGDELPIVPVGTSVKDALFEVSRKGLGMTAVVDANGNLVGLFTDGDLRRALDRDINLSTTLIESVMTRNPLCIDASHLAAEAVQIMETRKKNGLLVLDHGKLVGALNMHDLLRAGVV